MKNILSIIKDFIIDCLPIITVVISSLISYLVAKSQIKNEIDKLLIEISHNDKTVISNAFQSLIASTANFCQSPNGYTLEDTIKANAAFISVAPEAFQPLLLELDNALSTKDKHKIQSIRTDLISLYSKWINNSK